MEFLDNVRDWIRRLGNGVLDLASLAAVMIDEAYRLFDALGVLASRYGWALTPSIPPHVIFVLAAAARDSHSPHKDIYRLVRDHMNANDWQNARILVDGLREYSVVTPRRHKIIRDCVEAAISRRRRAYNAANVVLPALFAQVDGMLSEFAREVRIDRWASGRNKTALRAEFERVTYRFDEPALDLLFDVLFATTRPGQPLAGRRFNRHKILHGEWLGYGRVEHVLRTLLLLDFVGYVVEEHRQRQLAGDWDVPVTDKSHASKMWSENFVASIADIARERLRSRAFELPPLELPAALPAPNVPATNVGLYLGD